MKLSDSGGIVLCNQNLICSFLNGKPVGNADDCLEVAAGF